MPRILIVDDDPLIREILPLVLLEHGYESSTAPDGRVAMRELRRQAHDVVLTDVLMPDTDGMELLQEVRREFPAVRVIAMSGGSQLLPGSELLQVARCLGARAVLPKPFEIEALLTALKQTLQEE
jgi:DNA-binding response OmpR family regulator